MARLDLNHQIVEAYQAIPLRDREPYEKLYADYEVAVRLANGPDPARSKHWRRIATDRELTIGKELGLRTKRMDNYDRAGSLAT